MILGDKILMLRKQNGWSQEDLAELIQVSRQSVSKWEAGQSIPDMTRIIALSQIFGVSADFLIKDEYDTDPHTDVIEIDQFDEGAMISVEEAQAFLSAKNATQIPFSQAVRLCIYSPILLFLLLGLSHTNYFSYSEELAIAIGVPLLLIIVAFAVYQFIHIEQRLEPFKYIESEPVTMEYGVEGIVRNRKEQYNPHYSKHIAIGTLLCIISPIPLISVSMLFEDQESLSYFSLILFLLIVGEGVSRIIQADIMQNGFDMILEINDYSRSKKQAQHVVNSVAGIYWVLATTIYFIWSFTQNAWTISWIVWPIASMLFAILTMIIELFFESKSS